MFMRKRRLQMLIPTLVTGIALTGCGVAGAATSSSPSNQTAMGSANQASSSNSTSMANSSNNTTGNTVGSMNNSMGSSTGNSMGNTTNTVTTTTTTSIGSPLMTSDILVGAAASMAMGRGNGEFLIDSVGKAKLTQIPLISGANAFLAAISGNLAYVPTLQGQTYIVNLQSHMVAGHFATPKGSRIANIADHGKLLIITGSHSVTTYSLPDHQMKWQLNMGGNALAIAGGTAYLSGNMMGKTAVIDVASGKNTGSIAVPNIEDSVYDEQMHTLWLANWTNGDMTVVNTQNNQVVKTIHEAEGGGFNMKNMLESNGGFMQLAVGPNGNYVYAASFSGNIMVYSAKMNKFVKDIHVGATAKLSGIAIDPSGKYIYTTVENKNETVAVSLSTGTVVATIPGVVSNRWSVIHN